MKLGAKLIIMVVLGAVIAIQVIADRTEPTSDSQKPTSIETVGI
jgi:hypothetical protein